MTTRQRARNLTMRLRLQRADRYAASTPGEPWRDAPEIAAHDPASRVVPRANSLGVRIRMQRPIMAAPGGRLSVCLALQEQMLGYSARTPLSAICAEAVFGAVRAIDTTRYAEIELALSIWLGCHDRGDYFTAFPPPFVRLKAYDDMRSLAAVVDGLLTDYRAWFEGVFAVPIATDMYLYTRPFYDDAVAPIEDLWAAPMGPDEERRLIVLAERDPWEWDCPYATGAPNTRLDDGRALVGEHLDATRHGVLLSQDYVPDPAKLAYLLHIDPAEIPIFDVYDTEAIGAHIKSLLTA